MRTLLMLIVLNSCAVNVPQKKEVLPVIESNHAIALNELLATGHPVRLSIFDISPNQEGGEDRLLPEYVNYRTDSLWVIDRQNLDRIIREQQLQLSGAVSEETAIEAGRLVGVTHLLILDSHTKMTKFGEFHSRSEKLLDVETGRILSIDTTVFLTPFRGRTIMVTNGVAR
ncbi:MAG TPA: hypothetical protein ENI27_00175 [bacterium]|nr:hypothetical protein [bacterium]